MTHVHWVARQNKLETPKEKVEVNKGEVQEYDGRTRDPDTMVVPTTPRPTSTTETLTRATPTIVSSCEKNTVIRKWYLPRLCCVRRNPVKLKRVVYYESRK